MSISRPLHIFGVWNLAHSNFLIGLSLNSECYRLFHRAGMLSRSGAPVHLARRSASGWAFKVIVRV